MIIVLNRRTVNSGRARPGNSTFGNVKLALWLLEVPVLTITQGCDQDRSPASERQSQI
jgi:hypothetical protein